LPPRTNSVPAPESLGEQSARLLGYLDTLFQRLVLTRKPAGPVPECSREEIRALIALGSGARRTMSDLAGSLGVPLSTATHTVDRLFERNLVVRTRSDQDRRVVEVEMSPHGRKQQAAFRKVRQSMAQCWLEPLNPAERRVFLELMEKITRESPRPRVKQSEPYL